jgi:hypothetical protein
VEASEPIGSILRKSKEPRGKFFNYSDDLLAWTNRFIKYAIQMGGFSKSMATKNNVRIAFILMGAKKELVDQFASSIHGGSCLK